jgi:hypothetical protein
MRKSDGKLCFKWSAFEATTRHTARAAMLEPYMPWTDPAVSFDANEQMLLAPMRTLLDEIGDGDGQRTLFVYHTDNMRTKSEALPYELSSDGSGRLHVRDTHTNTAVDVLNALQARNTHAHRAARCRTTSERRTRAAPAHLHLGTIATRALSCTLLPAASPRLALSLPCARRSSTQRAYITADEDKGADADDADGAAERRQWAAAADEDEVVVEVEEEEDEEEEEEEEEEGNDEPDEYKTPDAASARRRIVRGTELPEVTVQGVAADFSSHPWPALTRRSDVSPGAFEPIYLPEQSGFTEPIGYLRVCALPRDDAGTGSATHGNNASPALGMHKAGRDGAFFVIHGKKVINEVCHRIAYAPPERCGVYQS